MFVVTSKPVVNPVSKTYEFRALGIFSTTADAEKHILNLLRTHPDHEYKVAKFTDTIYSSEVRLNKKKAA
jgi:hypothetical protein